MRNLLTSKRFMPLFISQFLGAFNDNLYKNSLTILLTYEIASKAGVNASLMVTLAAGLFILPFFLFSATAGKLADKYEKSRLIRRIKLLEICLMVLASLGLYFEHIWWLMGVLFLLGAQSAFFGPLKYSILPNHLSEDELIQGNALIETGTFLAILLGTIIGGLLILTDHGVLIMSVSMLVVALVGWLASQSIPLAKAAPNGITIRWNVLSETWGIIQQSRGRSDVFLSIIGISWFWFVGAIFLAQFPVFTKEILAADEQVVTLFLSVFSIGIGIGSMACNKLLKGKVTGSLAAPAALGMAVFTVALYVAASFMDVPSGDDIQTLGMFLSAPAAWAIIISLCGVAVCGGVYIVPLYALMQARSDHHECAQIIAANNIINAAFMVLSALLTLGLLAMGWQVTHVFLLMGIMNLPVAAIVRRMVTLEQAKRVENDNA